MRAPRGAVSLLVTIFAVVVLGLFLLFLRQVYIYYRQIRSGDLSGLPQFASQVSFTSKAGDGAKPGKRIEAATADDPSSGPADAKLTIVEFVDYQCPFSAEAAGTLRALSAEYADRVRFQIRDYPVLELHPEAILAAEAAGCAEAQGKFWIMHDRLYALRGQIDRPAIDAAAAQSGLDAAAFKACMDTHARLPEIQEDVRAGDGFGIRGTPTFYFNGKRIEGAIPDATFRQLIEAFLKG